MARLGRDVHDELAGMFHLLGDPNRLALVLASLDGPVSAGDLAQAVGLSQSLASHHLRLLRAARLMRSERRGRQVHYSIADAHVRDMLLNMIEHLVEPHAADGE